MLPATRRKQIMQKLANQKLNPRPKVANTFIQSVIHQSNIAALKVIYYLASILKDFDYSKDLFIIKIDLRHMLKYTELTIKEIRDNLIKMQETSISFENEAKKLEEHIALIPRIKIEYGKNIAEIDLYSKIAKLIVDTVAQYTFINTKQLMRLRNKHCLRMLPLLYKISQYDDKISKRVRYDLAEFNEIFGTSYKTLNDVERKILKPVKEELDAESEFSFVYDTNFDVFGIGRPKAIDIVIDLKVQKHIQPNLL